MIIDESYFINDIAIANTSQDSTLANLNSAIVKYEKPLDSVRKAVELSHGLDHLPANARVFIKPNIVFWTKATNFPKYGVEDLVKLKPGAVQTGKSEAEFTAGQLPTGHILILDPAP